MWHWEKGPCRWNWLRWGHPIRVAPNPVWPGSLLKGGIWTQNIHREIKTRLGCYLPCSSVGKASACSAWDLCSIPGLGSSPGDGNGNSRQYSCLENPMDREAWQVTVHGIARVGHGLVLSFFLSTSQGVPKTVSRIPEVGERPRTDSLGALRIKTTSGEFLAVPWLGLGAFTARARVQSSVQSLARETPQASIKEQKQQKKKKPQTFNLQNCKTIHFWYLSLLVCGALLQQLEESNTQGHVALCCLSSLPLFWENFLPPHLLQELPCWTIRLQS